MDFFTKTKVVKLRSHVGKHLVADEDQQTVHQTRNINSRREAKWHVEIMPHKNGIVRLKSCHGNYLTACDMPFLLGLTGKKVIQTSPVSVSDHDLNIEWEPIRDGFQVKLRSCRSGTFLRGNGGLPPWRNSVTHDYCLAGATRKWILWEVEAVEESETKNLVHYLSSVSDFLSVDNHRLDAFSDELNNYSSSQWSSPVHSSVYVKLGSFKSPRLTLIKSLSPRLSTPNKESYNDAMGTQSAMEIQDDWGKTFGGSKKNRTICFGPLISANILYNKRKGLVTIEHLRELNEKHVEELRERDQQLHEHDERYARELKVLEEKERNEREQMEKRFRAEIANLCEAIVIHGPQTNSSSNFKSDSSLLHSGTEFFHNAKAVRFRSHHDKYLYAGEDEESVTQGRNGSSKNAQWIVELLPGSNDDPPHMIRLKSCYGKYLTASNQPFLLGMTGRKAVQSFPRKLDSSLEWEAIREGAQVKLKARNGNFLRANGGLPPWRNSVTHDISHRSATQDWIVWNVDIVELQVESPSGHGSVGQVTQPRIDHVDSLDFGSTSPSSATDRSSFSRQESTDSNVGSLTKSDGRTIYYHVADETGDVDEDVVEGYSFVFKGNGVHELTKKLEEDTGLEDIVVCTRSPLNGKLYPVRLQLPPNSTDMHVIVVEQSSKGNTTSD